MQYANEHFYVERSRQLRHELIQLRENTKNEVSALLREMDTLSPFSGQVQADNQVSVYAALNAKRNCLRIESGASQTVVSQALQVVRERESRETIGTQLSELAATELHLRGSCSKLLEACETLWMKHRLLESDLAKRGAARMDLGFESCLHTSNAALGERWKALSFLSE